MLSALLLEQRPGAGAFLSEKLHQVLRVPQSPPTGTLSTDLTLAGIRLRHLYSDGRAL